MKYIYDIESLEKDASKVGVSKLFGFRKMKPKRRFLGLLSPKKRKFDIKDTFYGTPAGKMLTQASIFLMASAIGKFVDDMFEWFEERKEAKKKPEYYNKMLESHPELMDADPEVVAKLWSTLYHHSPIMAQDPVASGAFIRQSMARGFMEEYGGPSPDTYKTLTGIRKDVADADDKKGPGRFSGMGEKITKGTGHSMFASLADLLGEEYKPKENIFFGNDK